MTLPQLSNDTVLVLDKQAAINQSNYNLRSVNVRERFAAALHREEKLRALWLATEKQNKDYLMLSINQALQVETLEKQLALREEELDATRIVAKKKKRSAFAKGAGIGIVVGLVGGLILISK